MKVAVIGATGYTGGEIVRILLAHPRAKIAHLSASSERDLGAIFPGLRDAPLPRVTAYSPDAVVRDGAEMALLALPHGASAPAARELLAKGLRVIDLSSDFRLDGSVPFGLPELFRDGIAGAKLVANPGCYPTATFLALGPLLRGGLVEGPIAIHASSGVSGAGRASGRSDLLFAEVADSYRPYGLPLHRHTPEIEFHLGRCAGKETLVTFVPHLLPIARGILEAIYLRPSKGAAAAIRGAWEKAYAKEPFVRILPDGAWPEIRAVVGTNRCDLALHHDARTGTLVLFSAIDNLGKGAAGQAVQNLNLMAGWPETEGLADWAPCV